MSAVTLYGGKFISSVQLIRLNICISLANGRNTTICLATKPGKIMLHTTIIYQLVYAGYVSTLQILVLLLRLVVMLLKGLIWVKRKNNCSKHEKKV